MEVDYDKNITLSKALSQIQTELYKIPNLSRTHITFLLVPFVHNRLTFLALSSVIYLLRLAGHGRSRQEVFKNAHHLALLRLRCTT